MKHWTPDHPKAKLMDRKRTLILKAARDAFLRSGFERISMEAIAEAADVSIMTLYRHAESKQALFAAVIESACDPADLPEPTQLHAKPINELLTLCGVIFQAKLTSPEMAAILRAVIAESSRFPELAKIAFGAVVEHVQGILTDALAHKQETAAMTRNARAKISAFHIDQLVGTDLLRVLLGLHGVSSQQYQQQRAHRATAETMRHIAAASATHKTK